MRDPSSSAADGENSRRHPTLETQHPGAYGQIEIEIGAQPFIFPDLFFDFDGKLENSPAFSLGDFRSQLLEHHRSRVAGGIHRVAETVRKRPLPGELVETCIKAHPGVELQEHPLDT